MADRVIAMWQVELLLCGRQSYCCAADRVIAMWQIELLLCGR